MSFYLERAKTKKGGIFWKRGNERCTFAHSAYSSCPSGLVR